MKILWKLFSVFFKTGLFTFGGGYAMLPLLKEEVVVKHRWLSENELLDYFSIGQCTPGIIAVNVATFCGCKLKGIMGGLVATFAMILPSLIIITLIAAILNQYIHLPIIASAFAGIRIGVTALLCGLIIDMAKKLYHDSSRKIWHSVVFSIALLLLIFGNVSAVVIVILAALSGFIPGLFHRNKP